MSLLIKHENIRSINDWMKKLVHKGRDGALLVLPVSNSSDLK